MTIPQFLDTRDKLQGLGYHGIVARFLPERGVKLDLPVKNHTEWFLTTCEVDEFLQHTKGGE